MKRKNVNPEQLKEYSFLHTQQRAKERYDIILSKTDYKKLCENVDSGIGVFILKIERQKRGTQMVCKVECFNRTLYLTYLVENKIVTTLLPPESFEGEENANI